MAVQLARAALGLACCAPCAAAISPPAEVALAAGAAADTGVAITWVTDDPRDDDDSCQAATRVLLAPARAEADAAARGGHPQARRRRLAAAAAAGECLRYSFGATARTFGNYTSGRIHRVRVGGLEPDTPYAYSLPGDPAGTQRRFRTLPASSPPSAGGGGPPPQRGGRRYPISFGAVGDLGQTGDSLETVRHLDADPALRLVLHAGDMSYADCSGRRWGSYAAMVEPLSSRLQWMVCPGNHEIEADTFTGHAFVPYEARFAMPAIRPAERSPSPELVGCECSAVEPGCTLSVFTGHYDWGNSFYAFDAGPARVVSLNCYAGTRPGSAQHTWLLSELDALRARRAATPWLIVLVHCPLYNSNTNHQGEHMTVLMRDLYGYETLFFENNVSLVLTGHVHAYERTHPVYQNKTGRGGPSYIVVGDGGNREGHAKYYIDPQPGWSAVRNDTQYGHGKITLVNDTHMRWEWLINDAAFPPARTAADSPWRAPLRARRAADAAWIINPLFAAPPPPPGAAWGDSWLPWEICCAVVGTVLIIVGCLVLSLLGRASVKNLRVMRRLSRLSDDSACSLQSYPT